MASARRLIGRSLDEIGAISPGFQAKMLRERRLSVHRATIWLLLSEWATKAS